eukprot:4388207-Amphidinium_carterae.1
MSMLEAAFVYRSCRGHGCHKTLLKCGFKAELAAFTGKCVQSFGVVRVLLWQRCMNKDIRRLRAATEEVSGQCSLV